MTYIFSLCRKSTEVGDVTVSKKARTDHSNIIKINKRPASLETINKGINSVSINATSPSLDSRTGHKDNAVNKTAKPKVVKLNRKTLGLNLSKSVLKDELTSSLNGGKKVRCNRLFTWLFTLQTEVLWSPSSGHSRWAKNKPLQTSIQFSILHM